MATKKSEMAPLADEAVVPKIDDKQEAILAKLEALEARLATAEDEKEAYRHMVEELSDSIGQAREDGDTSFEPAAKVLYDPYYARDPFDIVGSIPPCELFPKGQTVSWKNSKYRNDSRGWRGWIPFQYGDQYTGKDGELLFNYIPDPPPRMEGGAVVDSYVRRTDSVLSRLDTRIFESRQQMRVDKSNRQAGSAIGDQTQVLSEGVSIAGPGLRKQNRPSGGFSTTEHAVVGENSRTLMKDPKEG